MDVAYFETVIMRDIPRLRGAKSSRRIRTLLKSGYDVLIVDLDDGEQAVFKKKTKGVKVLYRNNDIEHIRITYPLHVRNSFQVDNEERQHAIDDICHRKLANDYKYEIGNGVVFNDRLRIIYCATPKIASTAWKRLLLSLLGKQIKVSSSPHTSEHFKELKNINNSEIQFRLNNYAKVMISREPLERVLSGYRDKLENKANKIYNKFYGRIIMGKYRKNPDNLSMETGQGTTFTEFSQFLIDTADEPSDPHWAVLSKLCSPCSVQYDYIGKYESIIRDSNIIIREMAPYSHLSLPNNTNSHPSSGNSSLLLHYYRQLPAGTLRKLWKRYQEDYAMFGYPYPSDLEV